MEKVGEKGEKLVRRVTIKLFNPEGKVLSKTYRCPPTKGFNESGISQIIEHTAKHLESTLPHCEFRMVELPGPQFNFIYAGLKNA